MTIKEHIISVLKDSSYSRSSAQLYKQFPHLKLSSIASQLRKMVITKELVISDRKAVRGGNIYIRVPQPCEFCNTPPQTLYDPNDDLFNNAWCKSHFIPCKCSAAVQDRKEKLDQYYKEHDIYKDTLPCKFCNQMPIPPMMVCVCIEAQAARDKAVEDYTLDKAQQISEELYQKVLLSPKEYVATVGHLDMWGTTIDGKRIHGSVNVHRFHHNKEVIWTDPKEQREYEHIFKCIDLGIQPAPVHGDLFMAAKLIAQSEGADTEIFDRALVTTLQLRLEELKTVETTQGHKYGCNCKAKLCKKRREAIEYLESIV